jgi:heme-degrading monooxygenase HmoA
MTYQLRIYTLKPQSEEEFVQRWRRDLVPLRTANGFTVVGAWRSPEEHGFVWLVRWDGPGSFAEGERAYYAARDRAGLDWNPSDYLASMDLRLLEALDGFAP